MEVITGLSEHPEPIHYSRKKSCTFSSKVNLAETSFQLGEM